jgi:hypothetical protein
MWRNEPDQHIFDPLMKTIVGALSLMSSLQSMFFSMGEYSHWAQFQYLRPAKGIRSSTKESMSAQCIMTLGVELRWEIPDEVIALLKEYMGDAGDVFIEIFIARLGLCATLRFNGQMP